MPLRKQKELTLKYYLCEKIIDDTEEFKDNFFFKNLNDTERKVGNLDKTKIPHTFKEIATSEIVKKIKNADELTKKYTHRAKIIIDED